MLYRHQAERPRRLRTAAIWLGLLITLGGIAYTFTLWLDIAMALSTFLIKLVS